MEKLSNPFADRIVLHPSLAGTSVTGLNGEALKKLLDAVAILTEPPGQQLTRLHRALVVASAEPGLGKTHLAARLHEGCQGQATFVYLRPFQHVRTCWQTTLRRVVRLLNRPVSRGFSAAVGRSGAGRPTELTTLARAVLTSLLSEDGAAFSAPHSEGAADPAIWSGEDLRAALPSLEAGLRRRGVQISLPVGEWLTVLHVLACGESSGRRCLCIDWLMGERLTPPERAAIDIDAEESKDGGSGIDERNGRCKGVITDLCALSAFCRPFVFYFDQTELIAGNQRLSAAFGSVVAEFIGTGLKLLIVVATDRNSWLTAIRPNIAENDLARFSEAVIELEGLDREEALEMIDLRLSSVPRAHKWRVPFLASDWIDGFFGGEERTNTHRFITACMERWNSIVDGAHSSLSTFQDYHKFFYQKALADVSESLDEDDLLWLIRDAARCFSDVVIEEAQGTEILFPIYWKRGERLTCVAVCEDLTRFMRAITDEAVGQWERYAAEVVSVTALVLVTPAEHTSGGRGVELSRKQHLWVITVEGPQAALLRASRDLYAQTVQGNIAGSVDDALEFICQRLQPWWNHLFETAQMQVESKRVLAAADGQDAAMATASEVIPKAPVEKLEELPVAFHEHLLPGGQQGPGMLASITSALEVHGKRLTEESGERATVPTRKMSETDLLAACLDPTWRLRWIKGESVLARPFVGQVSQSISARIFHETVEEFVLWLADPRNVVPAAALADARALCGSISERFAEGRLQELAGAKAQELPHVREALNEFCRRLSGIRSTTPGFKDWGHVYLEVDYGTGEVEFDFKEGTIIISGRIDALRVHPEFGLEIVDYRLCAEDGRWRDIPQRDVLEIAINAQLIQTAFPERRCAGTLEYYGPGLRTITIPFDELNDIFRDEVEPVLQMLAEGRRAAA